MEIAVGLLIRGGRGVAETRMISLTSVYPLRCKAFSDLERTKIVGKAEKNLAFGHPSGSRGLYSLCLGSFGALLFEASQFLN